MAQGRPSNIGEAIQLSQAALLCLRKPADVLCGPVQIIQLLLGHFGIGRVDLLLGDSKSGTGITIKSGIVLDQSSVANGTDIMDDFGNMFAAFLRLPNRKGGCLL